MIKTIIKVFVVFAIIFVVGSFILQTCEVDTGKPPDQVDDTNYLVITTSRIYYTDSYEWDGETLILHGFWVREGKKWRQYDRDLRMPRESYGKVEVKER